MLFRIENGLALFPLGFILLPLGRSMLLVAAEGRRSKKKRKKSKGGGPFVENWWYLNGVRPTSYCAVSEVFTNTTGRDIESGKKAS